MRLFLLFIILAETLWVGLEFGKIANHYSYLESLTMYIFYNCKG